MLDNISEKDLEEEIERTSKNKTSGKIKNMLELSDLKGYMREKVGSPFATNVLRIALNFKEITIASMLVSKYDIQLDKQMLIRAIKSNQMQFIYCVYAFNKNYERITDNEDGQISDDSAYESSDDENGDPKPLKNTDKYYTYTFDVLFKLILQHCPDSYLPKIRNIAGFNILTSENFLMSLLINRQDVIAADKRFIKHYGHDLTAELMVFAIRNQNE